MTTPEKSGLATRLRTHTCGELRLGHVPTKVVPLRPPPPADDTEAALPRKPARPSASAVTLCGSVDAREGAGVWLRDRYGRTLVLPDADAFPYVIERFGKLQPEDVVQVQGEVEPNPLAQAGEPTGEIRVRVRAIEVLRAADPLPQGVLRGDPSPEQKLRYRHLYLRRPEVRDRLAFRAKVLDACREWLVENEFVELETPHLFWYDPVAFGGEVVPHGEGRAWRLPSGPVVLNQYLLSGEFDRSFQFTRVTRRERTRSPMHAQEHTSLDMNLCYADEADFRALVDQLVQSVVGKVTGKAVATPIQTMTFAQAMARYGSDKPDVRYALEQVELGEGGALRGLRAMGQAEKAADADLDEVCRGGAGLSWARVFEGRLEGPAAGSLRENPEWLRKVGGAPGDVVLLCRAGGVDAACETLGAARVRLARKLKLDQGLGFCWVTDYPFLELDNGNPVARVVVFSQVVDEDLDKIPDEKERLKLRAKAFDLIVNGVEVGSGYIGNTNLAVQRLTWTNVMGLGQADLFRVRAPIESHRFAVPPHGGVNLGFDRLVALLCGAPSLDEVTAFPKTDDCNDLLLDAPGPVPATAVPELLEARPTPAFGVKELGEETSAL